MTQNNIAIENRTGFVVFRPSLLQQRITAKHTVAVAGSSRGGTSTLAYLLARSDFPLGNVGDLNYEDKDIVKAINNKQVLRKLFIERNRDHDVWGFKVPEAGFHFDWLDIELRNPVFVYVMRNPASVARSIIARDPIYGTNIRGFADSLNHAFRYYAHFAETLKRLQSPVILVEYETIARSPVEFCKDFYACLGIDVGESEVLDIAKQISEPGYKNIINK